ncbi:hypothetical protein ACK3SF_05430 [Candidatus Nanosalina sp. VS9-1]|uniref:hypothetical protein n=1 Tax=Candidatus Nanosalina sp. VS9-1 TaxID=3388566 RepID=UPI0039E1E0F7
MNERLEKFRESLFHPFRSFSTGISALFFTGFFFLFSLLSSQPEFSMQMISSGISNWIPAVQIRLGGLIATSGYTGLILTGLFSALAAILLVNTVLELRYRNVNKNIVGILPGFLAAGCASCGVGLLTFLGFGGVLALLPYQGNLLRLGAVILLVGLINRNGVPGQCKA